MLSSWWYDDECSDDDGDDDNDNDEDNDGTGDYDDCDPDNDHGDNDNGKIRQKCLGTLNCGYHSSFCKWCTCLLSLYK